MAPQGIQTFAPNHGASMVFSAFKPLLDICHLFYILQALIMEMKKMKKIVSLLLAAVLVFGLAATGFAAAPEEVVLEEVTAESATAPEVDAPVVEEAPVAEAAAEEEPVADAADTQAFDVFVKDSASAQAIPNAQVQMKITDFDGSASATVGGVTKDLGVGYTKFDAITDSNGKLSISLTGTEKSGGNGTAGTIDIQVVATTSATSGLIYTANATDLEVVVDADGAITVPTQNGTANVVKTTEAAAAIGIIGGTITGTVKDADGKLINGAVVKVTAPHSATPVALTTNNGEYTYTTVSGDTLGGTYKVEIDNTVAASDGKFYIGSATSTTLFTTTATSGTLNITGGKNDNSVMVTGLNGVALNGVPVTLTETAGGTATRTKPTSNGYVYFPGNSGVTAASINAPAGTYNGLRYAAATPIALTGMTDGVFTAQTMPLTNVAALSDIIIQNMGNTFAATGAPAEFNATAIAQGFPGTAFTYSWQVKSPTDTSWTNVANGSTIAGSVVTVNGGILSFASAAATLNNYQFRVIANPTTSGYSVAEAMSAENCVAAGTLTVSDGYTVKGNAYNANTNAKIVASDATKYLNVWYASEYNNVNAKPVTTVAMNADPFSVTLPNGEYVMGIAPTTGNSFKTINTASGAFRTYGGTMKFTVNGAGITGLSLYLQPVSNVMFTTQPVDMTASVNGEVTFEAVAKSTVTPSAVPTYVWQVDAGNGFQNATGSMYSQSGGNLTIKGVTNMMNGYKYRVMATVSGETVASNIVTLNVSQITGIAIVQQPQDVSAPKDIATSMTVGIAGNAGADYQWQVDTGNGTYTNVYSGGMYSVDRQYQNLAENKLAGSKLTINANYVKSAINGYKYKVIITDTVSNTKVESMPATVTVVDPTPVSIVEQPVDVVAGLNRYAKFTVKIDGSGTPDSFKYKWQVSTDKGETWTEASGAVVEINNTPNKPGHDGKTCIAYIPVTSTKMKDNAYRVIATGTGTNNTAFSNIARITDVLASPVAPKISAQPTDQTAALYQKTAFSFGVDGTGPFIYAAQTSTDNGRTWTPSNTDVYNNSSNVTWVSYPKDCEVTPKSMLENGTLYKFAVREKVVTGSSQVIFTEAAKLTVTEIVKPKITKQPAPSIVGVVGGTVKLDVEVEGTTPFGYIWEKSTNGFVWEVVGSEASYTTPELKQEDDQTQYRVRVFNKQGDFVISDKSMLTVSAVPAEMVIKGVDSVYVGKTADYTIGIKPADAVYEVEWSIAESNAKKASIDEGGKLTAKAQGIIKVYAKVTTADGKVTTLSQKVSILKATTSFGLKSKENRTTLYKGGDGSTKYPWHTQLVLTNVKPSGASSSVKNMIWTSSNPKIATVENGKVKVAKGAGTKLGTVIITATDMGNPDSIATYAITVTKAK